MNKFYEKVNCDPALREKYDAVLKKHEATKDRDAVAAELAELAKAEGFNIPADEILNIPLEKGEISEEQLEKVSGGGSGWALCMFGFRGNFGNPKEGDYPNGPAEKRGSGYVAKCGFSGTAVCTWAGCRCWSTSHCTGGYHISDENGQALWFHAVTT